MKANTLTPELLHKMDAVTLDGYAASHRAVREFSEYPLEQDHRAIKSRIGPMLGFKDFVSAQITLAGVELYIAFGKGSSRFASSESQRRRRRSWLTNLNFAPEPAQRA
jgi:transposase-like protein